MFLQVINGIINPGKGVPSESCFFDRMNHVFVEKEDEINFLNEYFINIVKKLGITRDDNMCMNICDIDKRFCFSDDMLTIPEVLKVI